MSTKTNGFKEAIEYSLRNEREKRKIKIVKGEYPPLQEDLVIPAGARLSISQDIFIDLKDSISPQFMIPPPILRYARIICASEKQILLLGVNPQTGKHTHCEIEKGIVTIGQESDRATVIVPEIDPARIFKSENIHPFGKKLVKFIAQGSGIYNVERDSKGKVTFSSNRTPGLPPKFEILEEEGDTSREDSYLTIFSYCSTRKYNPIILRKLDELLVTMTDEWNTTKEIGKHLLNLTDKYGNVLFAIDEVRSLIKTEGSYITARYYVESAISNCKSCFDALASILNSMYSLDYSKGDIDLASQRKKLFNIVCTRYPDVGKKLKKYEDWINKITKFRDFSEHRIMVLFVPVSTLDEKEKALGIPSYKIPSIPITYGDKLKGPIPLRDVEDFLKELEDFTSDLIEIISSELFNVIEARKFVP